MYSSGALDLIIPDLLIYELVNTLRFKTSLRPAQVMKAAQDLWSLDLNIQPASDALSQAMVRHSYDLKISIYDAAFVALSEQVSATLVTADHSLYERAKDKHAVMLLADVEG